MPSHKDGTSSTSSPASRSSACARAQAAGELDPVREPERRGALAQRAHQRAVADHHEAMAVVAQGRQHLEREQRVLDRLDRRPRKPSARPSGVPRAGGRPARSMPFGITRWRRQRRRIPACAASLRSCWQTNSVRSARAGAEALGGEREAAERTRLADEVIAMHAVDQRPPRERGERQAGARAMGVDQRRPQAAQQRAQAEPDARVEARAEEVEAVGDRAEPGGLGERRRARLADQMHLAGRGQRLDQLQHVGGAAAEPAVGDRLQEASPHGRCSARQAQAST